MVSFSDPVLDQYQCLKVLKYPSAQSLTKMLEYLQSYGQNYTKSGYSDFTNLGLVGPTRSCPFPPRPLSRSRNTPRHSQPCQRDNYLYKTVAVLSTEQTFGEMLVLKLLGNLTVVCSFSDTVGAAHLAPQLGKR